MKRFLLLSLLSFTAQATCGNSSLVTCDMNFKCLESAIRNSESKAEEIDAYVEFSQKNRCQDELRVTNLYTQVVREGKGEGQDDDYRINESQRGNNTKEDLPEIPDTQETTSSQVLEQ